jgi:hypothetical protein
MLDAGIDWCTHQAGSMNNAQQGCDQGKGVTDVKSDKRKKARAAARAAKAAAINRPGGKSKYAQKKHEQRNGHYRPSSPFYTTDADSVRPTSRS